MSENPPDPWGGDDNGEQRRITALGDFFESMVALERKFHRRELWVTRALWYFLGGLAGYQIAHGGWHGVVTSVGSLALGYGGPTLIQWLVKRYLKRKKLTPPSDGGTPPAS